ncbi:MAG: MerR family transcriptional regulator [Alphaproteobacteria bacterium]|nr:MerR family transcriptional regulator [Alphaproteobacteria bacterium]
MTERRLVPAGATTAAFARARPLKSASAFRTISEVADQLDVPQHVLRFWETRFAQIRPLKRAGGRRYYRPEDVDLLRRIRELLYRDGYTIKGVQKLLRDNGRDPGDGDDDTLDVGDAEPVALALPTRTDSAPPAAERGAATAASAMPVHETHATARGDAHRALAELIGELESIRDEIAKLRGSR